MKLAHFAEPPTKGTKEILTANGITPPMADSKFKEEVNKLLDQIAAQEAQCLKTIHTRYCIVKGLPIDTADVSRYQPSKDQAPHLFEYWYKFGTPKEYMLMRRDLILVDSNIKLDIIFNKELIREGE